MAQCWAPKSKRTVRSDAGGAVAQAEVDGGSHAWGTARRSGQAGPTLGERPPGDIEQERLSEPIVPGKEVHAWSEIELQFGRRSHIARPDLREEVRLASTRASTGPLFKKATVYAAAASVA